MSDSFKSQIKKEMLQLYPPPAPEKKEKFLRELPYPRTGPIETIAVQIGYIRKSVWFLSLLLIAAALAYGENNWKTLKITACYGVFRRSPPCWRYWQ